jgi:hypothetical protein
MTYPAAKVVVVVNNKNQNILYMKKIIAICEHCGTKSNINILTGIFLLVLGAIDLSRGDYAFAGCWAIFGLMYLAFETKFRYLNLIGVYAGPILTLSVIAYYLKTY